MNPVATTTEEAEPLVSIIVPCYNSERAIRSCLESITAQRASVPFEVIVVDSSSDRTPRIVESEFPSMKLIHREERAFVGEARNIGIRAARGRYCLIIDSDCVASPDVVERMVARHSEANYAAVGGALRNGTPRSLSGWLGYLMEFNEFMPTAPKRIVSNSPPANMAYRREVFDRYGFFEEDESAEDILFNWKLTKAGERILFDPTIEVTHLNRTGWRVILSYQKKLGRMSALARRRSNLPGKILIRHPVLIALMPFFRLIRTASRLASYDRKALLGLFFIWPIYLMAAAFWSFGFWQEALKKTDESNRDSSVEKESSDAF